MKLKFCMVVAGGLLALAPEAALAGTRVSDATNLYLAAAAGDDAKLFDDKAVDLVPSLPVKIADADKKRLAEFETTRERAISAALAGGEAADVAALRDILAGERVNVGGDGQFLGKWRCRSAQLDSKASSVFVYPYFRCEITRRGANLFLAKVSGSQRVSGTLYRAGDDRFVFLGGSSVNNDPQRAYGNSEQTNIVGYAFGTASHGLRLETPQTCCSELEILDLVR